MVKSVNAQITSLAPVLNSPTVTSGWSQGPGTTAMVKWAESGKAAKKRCKSKNGKKRQKRCKKKENAKQAAKKRCKSKKGKKCKKKAKGSLYVFAGSAGSPVEGQVLAAVRRQRQGCGPGREPRRSGPRWVL